MRVTRPTTRIEKRAGVLGKVGGIIWLAIVIFLGTGLGLAVALMMNTTRIIPADIEDLHPTQGTTIYSSDGVHLATISEENREIVKLRDIPDHLKNGIVAVEDSRFYTHAGVDPRGIVRAIVSNVRGGRVLQGGSTITQQLARNIYLTRKRTITRKLQEAALAMRIERNYSKDQILELYLNQVYFGSRAYGVQAASKVYFGKDVKDLSLAECALLAGLPRRPSVYSPYENPNLARERRAVVLDKMAELGYISRAQAERAKREPVRLAGMRNEARAFRAPYFTTYVLKQLGEQYGDDVIRRSGFKVTTTLNYEMQKAAESALVSAIKNASRLHVTQGALVCVEPKTGFIRAMVGGVDFKKSQFNRATQARRQPGSAFKIFVYTAAVANGIKPGDRFSGRVVSYPGAGGRRWTPRNYDRRHYGRITVRRAVADSVNTVAVKVLKQIGVKEAIKYARLMGITSHLDPYLSLALGSSGVSPLEMASATSVLPAGGYRSPPTSILRIEDADGVVIEEADPVPQKVLDDRVVETMNDLLRGVVTSGTGRKARAVPNAHGKTGTTNDHRNAWFVGYTPELCTAVWVGNDDESPMRGVVGGTIAVPVWTTFMLKALKIRHEIAEREKVAAAAHKAVIGGESSGARDREPRPEERGDSDTSTADTVSRLICADSGLLARRACPNKHEESFIAGFEPKTYCTLHRSARGPRHYTEESDSENADEPNGGEPAVREVVSVTICADTGLIANFYCPNKIVRTYPSGEQPTRVCGAHRSTSTYR